jgi:acetylornithine deacetylase/succinyl-diaminopimelate desuccinylase-like protein
VSVSEISWDAVRDEAAGYLRDLIRIDTTNPPGNERAAAGYIADVLSREGFQPRLFEPAPERVSVLARLPGGGERGPLLLQGHTDVVPTDPSEWSRPPFSGDLADGCIWGRGALDMKGTVVMQLMALLLAQRTGLRPRGDIIFAALADEEAGGFLGAGWLVDNEPDLVRAEVALGEVGGFTMYVGDQRFYPIQVSEKVGHGLSITVRGASGHGSQPIRDGAMAKAGEILSRLTANRLPHHVTPVTEQFVRALAQAQPQLLGLLDPNRVGQVLGEMGQDARMFEALLHNTAVPTVIHGGSKSNVIPGSVQITIDGRLLPGQTSEEFMREVRDLIGKDLEIEPRHTPSFTEAPVDGFFAQFQPIIDEMDPGAIVVPTLVSGVTDARFFARLGTPTYGFGPVKLSRDMPFWSLFHSADERIPVDGLLAGCRAVFRVVEQY